MPLLLSQAFTSRTVRHFQRVFIFQSHCNSNTVRLDNLNNGDVASQCGEALEVPDEDAGGDGSLPRALRWSPVSEGALGRTLRASSLASVFVDDLWCSLSLLQASP